MLATFTQEVRPYPKQRSFLNLAISWEEPDIVKCILDLPKTGKELAYRKDIWGIIPLHEAAYIGNEKIVKLFLEKDYGKDLTLIKNKCGDTARYIATQRYDLLKEVEIKCRKIAGTDNLVEYIKNKRLKFDRIVKVISEAMPQE